MSAGRQRRSYAHHSALARALDVVGERWTLLVVEELLDGPRRYTDLIEHLGGIGTNLLAARLRDLEAAGLVERRVLAPPAGSTVYTLTEAGQGLRPVVMSLARWGEGLDSGCDTEVSLARWGIVGLTQILFRPERARGLQETYEFRADGEVFHVSYDNGTAWGDLGPATKPAATFVTDGATFRSIGEGRLTAAEALARGSMRIEGDPAAAFRFARVMGAEVAPTPDALGDANKAEVPSSN